MLSPASAGSSICRALAAIIRPPAGISSRRRPEQNRPRARQIIHEPGYQPPVRHKAATGDLIDYVHIVVVPIVLGRGERLWDGLEALEDRFHIEAASSPSGVTHVTLSRR